MTEREFSTGDRTIITEEKYDAEPLSMHGVRLGDEAIIYSESNPPYDYIVDVYRNGENIVDGIGVKSSEISPISCGKHKSKLLYSKSKEEFYCPFCEKDD